MKRFEFAAEVSKQLLTVSAAIITLDATFMEKFLAQNSYVYILNIFSIFFLTLSALFGIFSLGGIVNLSQTQEENDANKLGEFIKLNGPSVLCARLQQTAFFAGLFVFFVMTVFGKFEHVSKNEISKSSDIKSTSTPKPPEPAANNSAGVSVPLSDDAQVKKSRP